MLLNQLCLVKLELLCGSELLLRIGRGGKKLVVALEGSQSEAQFSGSGLSKIVGGLHLWRRMIVALMQLEGRSPRATLPARFEGSIQRDA